MHTLRRTIAGVVFGLTGLADITMLLTRLHTPVTLKAMLVSGPILQEQWFTIHLSILVMKKGFSLIAYPILLLLDTGHKHRSEGSPWQNISCIHHKTCKSTIYMYNSSITIFKELYSSFNLFNMHALCMFHLSKIIFTRTALKCFKIQCF